MSHADPITAAMATLVSAVDDRVPPDSVREVRSHLDKGDRGRALALLTHDLARTEALHSATLSPHERRLLVALHRILGQAGFADHPGLDLDAPDQYICPSCGYPELPEPPMIDGDFSHEICPSCGFHFGFDDDVNGETYEQWRRRWIAAGMQWRSARPAPAGWNGLRQLQNLRSPDRSAVVRRLADAGCVFAEDEAVLLLLECPDADRLEQMITRREAGEPLEHIVGYAEFHGTRIHLDPGVFIPRRRTEALVDEAMQRSADDSVVLDLCCGSGALGAVIARLRPTAEVHAADIDPAAVACARHNLANVHRADLFDGLPTHLRGRIDVLVANVPYVPSGDLDAMPAEARDHEPRATHDGGADGHDVLRRLLADAPRWITPGGLVLTEIAKTQQESARDAFATAGFAVEIVTSGSHDATIVVGTRR